MTNALQCCHPCLAAPEWESLSVNTVFSRLHQLAGLAMLGVGLDELT